jgi:hypothetical protein
MNILAPKMGVLHRVSQTQNCSFLKNRSNDFDCILNKTPWVISSGT